MNPQETVVELKKSQTVCIIGVGEITFWQECRDLSDLNWHKITIENIYSTVSCPGKKDGLRTKKFGSKVSSKSHIFISRTMNYPAQREISCMIARGFVWKNRHPLIKMLFQRARSFTGNFEMKHSKREIFIHIMETVSCKKIKMESQNRVSNDFLAENKPHLVAPLYYNGNFSSFRSSTFDIPLN